MMMMMVRVAVMMVLVVVDIVVMMRILGLGDELESEVAGKKGETGRRKEGFAKGVIIKEAGPMVEGSKRIVRSPPCTSQ